MKNCIWCDKEIINRHRNATKCTDCMSITGVRKAYSIGYDKGYDKGFHR